MNRTIALLLNTTNFGPGATPVPGYSLISGATAGYFLRTDINQCWENLVNEGVPTEDERNMFFITSPTAYGGMLGDQTMSYQYIVGDRTAIDVQQRAKLQLIFGAEPRYDQHFGQVSVANGFTANKQPGALLHRYAIAGVTAQPAPTDQQTAQVQEQIIWLKNVLPVQMQVGYSLPQQGTIVHLHCYWGCAVARADFCSLVQSN